MTQNLNPDSIVVEYKSLVHGIAAKYKKSGLDKDDLVQEGMLGLLEACKRYEPDRNLQFSTYATYWIKKYILLAISKEHKHTLNVSSDYQAPLPDVKTLQPPRAIGQPDISFKTIVSAELPDLEQTILNLSFKHNKTIREIAGQLHLTPEKVRQIRTKAMRRIKSKNPQG